MFGFCVHRPYECLRLLYLTYKAQRMAGGEAKTKRNRSRERKGERERGGLFHVFGYFPRDCKSQVWARLKCVAITPFSFPECPNAQDIIWCLMYCTDVFKNVYLAEWTHEYPSLSKNQPV